MRNILILLTLCVLSLTTSSVFAEVYDDSLRTERLGLSYYAGRPLYVVMFGYTGGSNGVPASGYSISYYRMNTGDNIDDFGTADFNYYEANGRLADVRYGDTTVHERYFYSVIDADGMVVYAGNHPNYTEPYTAWLRDLLKDYPPPAYSEGDIGVSVFDAMLEPLSQMLRGWMGVVLAIGAVMFGWNFIRELLSFGSSGVSKSKSGKGSAPLTYSSLSRRDRSFYEDAAFGDTTKLLVPKTIKKEVDFITGAAFGLNFDEKTRESNRLLMEAFNRLSRKEQKEILQAFRETAFDKSFEDSAEKRFLAYQGEVFDDVDNPFTGRAKRRTFDPLDGDELAQGYGSDYVGWADMEIDDANASLDAAYYEEYGGTPF